MINIVFLFVGVLLLVLGFLIYPSLSEEEALPKYIFLGVMGGLGGLFTLFGLVGMVRRSKLAKEHQHILQTGIDAEGTVTFVDKNYSILINQRPIYSIIEYTYKDIHGTEHTNRTNRASSETIIRQQIQVGTKMAIKYSAENPGNSIIIM